MVESKDKSETTEKEIKWGYVFPKSTVKSRAEAVAGHAGGN